MYIFIFLNIKTCSHFVAEGALEKMAKACGYSDMTELITNNIDYVTHFMDMKLRNIENCPEIFDIFCVIVKYSQENTLPIICDIIEVRCNINSTLLLLLFLL